MLYLQIASPKSSVLNFLDSNSFEVIISIFQRTEKVPDMERLRKIRREAYEHRAELPDVTKSSELSFVEVPLKAPESSDALHHTDISMVPSAVLKTDRLTIEISNDISASLLTGLLQEVLHA